MPVTPNSIVTPQTPKSAAVIHSAQQNTWPPTTNPTNSTLLVTAGANGGRLTRLTALPHESTAAVGVMQAYRDVGTSGASKYLFNTVTCANDTVSGTDAPSLLDFGYSEDNALVLQANERVYVAHSLSNKAIGFTAEWADY
jgi:hypothetical protein